MDKAVQQESKIKKPFLFAGVVVLVFFLLAALFYSFSTQQNKGLYLGDLDLDSYQSIQARGTSPNILIPGEDGLRRVEAMVVEARDLDVYPTREDIDQRAIEKYGDSDEDTKMLVEVELLVEVLSNQLTYWREVEFLAVRFDVLPKHVALDEISSYESLASGVLLKVENKFKSGESVSTLAEEILKDPTIKKDFVTRSVQFVELSDDPEERVRGRVLRTRVGKIDTEKFSNGDFVQPVNKEPLALEVHILEEMEKGDKELWCDRAACYLIRVQDSSNGQYDNIFDWLEQKGL